MGKAYGDFRQGGGGVRGREPDAQDIEPELTARGKLALSRSPSEVSRWTLVISNLWGTGEVKIDLGL